MCCEANPALSAHVSVFAAAPARTRLGAHVCTCVLCGVPRSGGPRGEGCAFGAPHFHLAELRALRRGGEAAPALGAGGSGK